MRSLVALSGLRICYDCEVGQQPQFDPQPGELPYAAGGGVKKKKKKKKEKRKEKRKKRSIVVKDSVLSLLCLSFNPWLRNSPTLQIKTRKRKERDTGGMYTKEKTV